MDSKLPSPLNTKEIEEIIRQNILAIFSKHDCESPQIDFKYNILTHDHNKKLRRVRRIFESEYFK